MNILALVAFLLCVLAPAVFAESLRFGSHTFSSGFTQVTLQFSTTRATRL